jgi:hypothetical protein
MINGSIAAGSAAFITTPMDVLKSKMMTDRNHYYKGALDCAKKIFSEDGIKGFFKGAVLRTLPLSFTGTIFFTSYEQYKKLVSKFLAF